MRQITKATNVELQQMADNMYGDFVKAIVDTEKKLLVVDMEMHVDGEQFLLESGSKQDDIWGINLYPNKFGTNDFIEFDSMVNIRPRTGNMSRTVENPEMQAKIRTIVSGVVHG